MPEEEVVVDQDHSQADQAEPDLPQEDVADVVEFDEEEPESPAPPADDETAEATETAPAAPPEYETKVSELQKEVARLGYALRQKEKEAQKPKEEGEPLTRAQLVQLMRDYGNDPETILNVMEYYGQQAAKKASTEQVTVQRTVQMKQANDQLVSTLWPEIHSNPTVQQNIAAYKQNLNLADHPMADHLAASAWVAENLPVLQKQWYDRGKQDGLKGKVDSARKDTIRANAPVGGPRPKAKAGGIMALPLTEAEKAMNLTPSQLKTWRSLTARKGNPNMAEV